MKIFLYLFGFFTLFSSIYWLGIIPAVSQVTNPPNNECSNYPVVSYAPITRGSLQLASLNCNMVSDEPTRHHRIAELGDFYDISPDGNWVTAHRHKNIAILSLHDGKIISQPSRKLYGSDSLPTLQWSKDSSFVWASQRETVKPSGFAISALQPIQVFTTGEVKLLPPLMHKAGFLDRLLWIDNEGLALAAFGIDGSYYKPEHEDPDPTFAIVDAARGVVLDSFSISKIFGKTEPDMKLAREMDYTMRKLPDGRVKIIISVYRYSNTISEKKWIVWTQGEKPQLLDNPYSELGGTYAKIYITLTPDGTGVLVSQLLRTKGAIIREIGSKDYAKYSGYTAGKPVEGILAVLYDLDTSKERWRIEARVTKDSNPPPKPVISGDGKFALLSFPADGENAYTALISMNEGKTLQRLPTGYSSGYAVAMGFNNESAWINFGNVTALYQK